MDKAREHKVQVHRDICRDLNTIYAAKNHDYGDSFAKVRADFPNAVLVRIADKFERLKQLMNGEKAKVKESVDDTLIDLANYCIMELVERVIKPEEPQKETEICPVCGYGLVNEKEGKDE